MPGGQNPPTRDTWGRGKIWVTGKKIVLFLPLKIGKSSKVGVFCSCSVHFFFFNLRPQRACYLLKIYGRVFLKRIKTCKSILYKKLHQPVTRIGQFKGLYFSSGHFFPLNIKVMLVYYRKKKYEKYGKTYGGKETTNISATHSNYYSYFSIFYFWYFSIHIGFFHS